MQRIFWMESNGRTLRSLAEELGLKQTPRHIVVFLPRYIEDELRRKELAYEGRQEEEIDETSFKFLHTEKGFVLEVASQRSKQE
jgi:hypothetical protein